MKYPSNFDDQIGARTFVDNLTIDYKKTLSEYKSKLLEEARNRTIS